MLDGNRCNHAVNRFADPNPFLPKRSVKRRSSNESRLSHGKEYQRLEMALRFPVSGVGSDPLENFGKDDTAETQVLIILDQFL